MKKNEFIYPAIFLVAVLLFFAIPVGAFLTSEIVGFEITRSIGGWIYTFLKDHGSLFAGILGFGGIFILVWSQNKSTQKTVDATLEAIKAESKEIERRNNKRCILNIITEVGSMAEIAQSNLRHLTYEYCKSHLKNIKESSQELLFSNMKDGKNIVFFMEAFGLFCQDILKYQSGVYSTSRPEYIAHISRLRDLVLKILGDIERDAEILSTAGVNRKPLILEATNKMREHLGNISFELYPAGYDGASLLHTQTLQGLHVILVKHDIYATWLLNLNNNA